MLPGSAPPSKLRVAVFQDHIDVDLTVSTICSESILVRVEHICGLSLIPLHFISEV